MPFSYLLWPINNDFWTFFKRKSLWMDVYWKRKSNHYDSYGHSKFPFVESVVSVPVELKLRLHTTHPSDFWFGKRSSKYILLYQKSSVWVVRRRRYGHFTMKRTKNEITISPPTHNPHTLIFGTVIYTKIKKTTY